MPQRRVRTVRRQAAFLDHLPSSNTFLALYVRLGFTTLSNMHSHLAQSVVLTH